MEANDWIEEESDEEIHEEDPEEDLKEESDKEIYIGEIVDEPNPIRGKDKPLPPPPPSSHVYRNLNGGPLWMNTHHKRVLPIQRLTSSLIYAPV